MPDLLSDFNMPSSYRKVAISRITNTATLYSAGSSNTVGIVEVVGSGAEVSPGYNYGTLRLEFPQAVKAVINFSLKRLM